jgi:hypothetical protein
MAENRIASIGFDTGAAIGSSGAPAKRRRRAVDKTG